MKFGQLIEYNMRINFLEKSPTKWDGETSPKTLSGKSKLSVSLDQVSSFMQVVFIYLKLRAID